MEKSESRVVDTIFPASYIQISKPLRLWQAQRGVFGLLRMTAAAAVRRGLVS
jgi:hypothetical protein